MKRTSKPDRLRSLSYGVSLALFATLASAHDLDEAGTPVCTEANYMMADAMNEPFATTEGPGRLIEMNIFTGTPGITVDVPFNDANVGTDICPAGVVCPGPWKPTGVLSGGLNGHAFITSAAQHALTQFHRDGTPIKTISYNDFIGTVEGEFGTVPRPLGTQVMPNGNLIQAICDANFFNASNSDVDPDVTYTDPNTGETSNNASWKYFPPVFSTSERAANSRLLVIDQETMQVIDEYSQPKAGELGHDQWGCFAGIMFSDEGMLVSTFHHAAVLVIDWTAGLDKKSTGVGSNSGEELAVGKPRNRAKVTRVIDFRPGTPADDPSRRDSLRAISYDESGNVYATDRERSRDCLELEAPNLDIDYAGLGISPCNPGVFRQRVNIVPLGESSPTRTLALDPGVNVIAGIRTNRISGPGCDYVKAHADIYATEFNPLGYASEEDLCDVETLLVAASAMSPGCDADGDGVAGPGHAANQCFVPGGGVAEYLIHPNFVDGAQGPCTGDPDDPASNTGCAQPIAMFDYRGPSDTDAVQNVDPRMLMVIHEAFGQ